MHSSLQGEYRACAHTPSRVAPPVGRHHPPQGSSTYSSVCVCVRVCGRSLSDKASVARIVKGGIEYVMASPSTRMAFLPRALTDFTKKLSKEDANALVAWFQDNQPAPNAGYDRKPFYEYFNTLRKLVELDPVCEFFLCCPRFRISCTCHRLPHRPSRAI